MQQVISGIAQIVNDVMAAVTGMSDGVLKTALGAAIFLFLIVPPAITLITGVLDHD